MFDPITPAILMLLLRAHGYEVTERCLTDWRWKGYLPQLMKRSRGFRRGVLRYWPEKDILRQALELCHRLKGSERKRIYGAVHKNWLAGANIPTPRARESWINEIKRTARFSKELTQRCATQIGVETRLNSGTVRDAIEEFLKIWIQPNYPVGKTQDISIIRTVVQRELKNVQKHGKVIVIEEGKLSAFLSALNATFSPAGFRNAIAGATNSDLLQARNSYLNWWQRLNNACLRGLAHSMAPLIVPLLLPIKAFEGRPARLEAV